MNPYIVHLGYVIMLGAFLVRDVLWIRSTLIVAQAIVASYAWSIHVPSIAAWNGVFLSINIAWVTLILRERRAIQLPDELREIYARHFSSLSPQNFLRFWGQGRRETLRDTHLAREGHVPDSLFFVRRGTVRVLRGDRPVTELAAGSFVAEMSLLTNQPATADAVAASEVEVMRWPASLLRAMPSHDPALWTGVQSVLGYDLVEKIKRGTADKIGARA